MLFLLKINQITSNQIKLNDSTLTSLSMILPPMYPVLITHGLCFIILYVHTLRNVYCSVVDLRWGIRDHATNDHSTTQICMSEIDRCLNTSIDAPCFVYLAFEKYGVPSLPWPQRSVAHYIWTVSHINRSLHHLPSQRCPRYFDLISAMIFLDHAFDPDIDM